MPSACGKSRGTPPIREARSDDGVSCASVRLWRQRAVAHGVGPMAVTIEPMRRVCDGEEAGTPRERREHSRAAWRIHPALHRFLRALRRVAVERYETPG